MRFFDLSPAFQKERFHQIERQIIQVSFARFPQVAGLAGGFQFEQILFNFLVQLFFRLFFLARMAAADDFG